MGGKEIYQILSYLTTDKKVAASTQNRALNSLGFLYKHVSGIKLGDFGIRERAGKPERLPNVMTKTVEWG
jgi:hypothetical protein